MKMFIKTNHFGLLLTRAGNSCYSFLMAAVFFNSQNSTFLPREDFFSQAESSLSDSTSSSTCSTSCPPPPAVTVPLSQPTSDTIYSRYKELIGRRTIPGIKCIDELINWKFSTRESVFGCIFGVVKSVRDSRGTKFKYVTIIDPTHQVGIELETFEMEDKIAVGQMMKATNLKVQRTGSSLAFMFTTSTKTSFFPLFSYNYDDPMSDERNKALTETRFIFPEDREICQVLEKWFSLRILNGTKLSTLPKPGEFVDICCQVLAYNKSPLCMNAVIWDTSEPKYKPLFGADGRPPSGLECINYDYFHVAYEKYFALTVWKEESYDQAQHYDTFKCIDLIQGDDLVVLFNLQVIEDANHPGKASLVMRSSRKWGKAVRLCHWNSILGRMFLHKCEEYRKEFRRKLGFPDTSEMDKPRQIKSPLRQSPSKSVNISTSPMNQNPKTNNTNEASFSQNNGNSSPSNHNQLIGSNIQDTKKPIDESKNASQHTDDSISDSHESELEMLLKRLDQINKEACQANKNRKRKAADEILIEQFEHIVENSLPSTSTSRYSLRSQTRSNKPSPPPPQPSSSSSSSSSSQVNQQSTKETSNVDLLTSLKTKAEKFLNWDKLLSNGPEKLKLLVQILEEGDLRDESSPLTREEHIQYILLAIDFLEKKQSQPKQQQQQQQPNPNQSSPSAPINSSERSSFNLIVDSDDSNMTDETFPVIPRVRYVSNAS